MVRRFDITTKRLRDAVPCVVQMIREDGSIEWYEGAKAGQLMECITGRNKVFFNLDYNKITNFTVQTNDSELEDAEKTVKEIKKNKKDFDTKVKTRVKQVNEQTLDIKDVKKLEDYTKKLKQKYNNLDKARIKNFGTKKRAIMGFVVDEREFNALPYRDIKHDSRQITQWLNTVRKNYKDFVSQRIEGIKSIVVIIIIGILIGMFLLFKYGDNFFTDTTTAKTVANNLDVAKLMLPIWFMKVKKKFKRK